MYREVDHDEIGSVICAACGARIRADRERCLRCEEPLVAWKKPEMPLPSWIKALGGGTLIFGVVGALVVITVVVLALNPTIRVGESVVSSKSNVSVKSAAPGGATAVSGSRIDPLGFVDARQRGDISAADKDLASVRVGLERLLASKPGDAETLNKLGLTLERMGQVEAAVHRYEEAVRVDEKAWAYHFNLAHAASLQQDWKRAVDEYGAARDLAPTDYATQYNLAVALHRMGNDIAAIPEFEKAIMMAPGVPEFRLSLALSLDIVGRVKDAQQQYQKYLTMMPNAPDREAVRTRLSSISGQLDASSSTSTTP